MLRSVISSFFLAIILGGCSSPPEPQHAQANTSHNVADACDQAAEYIKQGTLDYAARDYSGGYKNVNHAFDVLDSCHDKGTKAVYSAAAYSVRSWNEHHLPQGNSVKDALISYAMLKACVDSPDTPQAYVEFCKATAAEAAQATTGW